MSVVSQIIGSVVGGLMYKFIFCTNNEIEKMQSKEIEVI